MHVFLLVFIVTSWWTSADAANYLHNEITKREVKKEPCYMPEPLANGSFHSHHRLCPSGLRTDACSLVPGTPVPHTWVLYYSCHSGYELSGNVRASVCRNGQWMPAFPTCLPSFELISREAWGSEVEVSPFPSQEPPLTRVIIMHTVTDQCNTRPDCQLAAQSIQRFHRQQYGDIGYSFLVGGEGSVLEGQGWDHVGAHTYGYNTGSLGIALIGNFVSEVAPEVMLEVTRKLIERGIGNGKLSRDYQLFAHCQLIQIASPGRRVFDKMKLWRNWVSTNGLRCVE